MTTLADADRDLTVAGGPPPPRAVERRRRGVTLTGVGRLTRFVLRRDRIRLTVWLVSVGGLIVISAASLPPVYPDQATIDTYVRLFGDNPALIAFAGPGYGFDDPNIGVILVNETQLWGIIAVALMSIFLLNRHTRAEEDDERTDLLRSNVVGRHAPSAAAVGVVTAANVVVAVVCAVGFIALDYPVAGSIALAGSFLAVGLAFVGITIVAAQVASTGRATLGLASAVLVVTFLLRAVGDIGDNALRWLSPIGWAQSVRAFAGEQWWTLALSFAFAAGMIALGFWLSTRRDPGSGMLPVRPGPAHASASLVRPVGLAVRLQRGAVVGWAVGLLTIGIVYGSIGNDIEKMVEENPVYADYMAQVQGANLTDSFLATSLVLQSVMASGFAIAAVLRLRSEEGAGRAESLLAGPLSRRRWAASHLTVSVVGSAIVVGAGGLGIGLAYAVVSSDSSQVLRMVGASLATMPAVLVLIGLATALYGLVPRWALAAWGALAVVVIVGLLGELLRLPQWSRQVSPFEHLPALPAESFSLGPTAALLALAAALAAAGLWGLRRRDLNVS